MRSGYWLKLFPFLLWWRETSRVTLRADASAGLTGAIVVLPQGVAFATLAGLPPQYGLYTAMLPAIVAALFGSSRHLVSGPTTAASIVLFASISEFAEPGSAAFISYALTLTFMVGVIQLALGLARMGVLVNFISHSVIVGFTAGAAVLIATNQIEHFLGIVAPRDLHFHETFIYFYRNLHNIQPMVALVGIVTLVAAFFAKQRLRKIPYMVMALVVATVVTALINEVFFLGSESGLGVPVVGNVPGGLPPLSSPDFSFKTLQTLAPIAFAVTLFALTEAVSISRSIAARSGQYIDGNQEFIGQGLSNLIGSFFSSYVATGSFNRSGVNYESGAQTPLSAVIAGVLLMIIVFAVAPALSYLPKAGMAAILFIVAWGLIDFAGIKHIVTASKSESVVLWATFLATLFLSLEFAILLGVFLSLVVYLMSVSTPTVAVRMPDPRRARRRFATDGSLPECPQLSIVRIDGGLFFGAIGYVAERLRVIAKRNPEQKHQLVFAQSITTLDVAGAELLAREAVNRQRLGGGMYFQSLKESAKKTLAGGGYLEAIGERNFFDHKGEAIASIVTRLDMEVCAKCTARVFAECAALPGSEPKAQADSTEKSST